MKNYLLRLGLQLILLFTFVFNVSLSSSYAQISTGGLEASTEKIENSAYELIYILQLFMLNQLYHRGISTTIVPFVDALEGSDLEGRGSEEINEQLIDLFANKLFGETELSQNQRNVAFLILKLASSKTIDALKNAGLNRLSVYGDENEQLDKQLFINNGGFPGKIINILVLIKTIQTSLSDAFSHEEVISELESDTDLKNRVESINAFYNNFLSNGMLLNRPHDVLLSFLEGLNSIDLDSLGSRAELFNAAILDIEKLKNKKTIFNERSGNENISRVFGWLSALFIGTRNLASDEEKAALQKLAELAKTDEDLRRAVANFLKTYSIYKLDPSNSQMVRGFGQINHANASFVTGAGADADFKARGKR